MNTPGTEIMIPAAFKFGTALGFLAGVSFAWIVDGIVQLSIKRAKARARLRDDVRRYFRDRYN